MKKNMCLVFFLLIVKLSIGQLNSEQNQLLGDFVKKDAGKENVYYRQYLDERLIDAVIKLLRRSDSIYSDVKLEETAPFVFTKSEKDIIKKQLLAQKGRAWDSATLKNVILLKQSDIPPLSLNTSKQERVSYFSFFAGKTIIDFSMPVLLRDNTICVFYYGKSFPNTGSGELIILRKENGYWKQVVRKTTFMS